MILHNFTLRAPNIVADFCFVTRLFNEANSNKNQTPLELSFFSRYVRDQHNIKLQRGGI